MSAVFGTEPRASRQCEPSTVRPSVSVTVTASPCRSTDCIRDFDSTVMPRRVKTLLEHLGGVGVLAGQHPVAAGDQRDVDAERVVGAGELGAGDARPDDDQVGGRLVERVDLLPGQDPLPVGHGRVERARRGAGRQQHGVRLERLLLAPVDRGGDDASARPSRRPRARSTRTPSRVSRRSMSADWACASRSTRSLTCSRSVDQGPLEADAELLGLGHVGHQLGRRDQGLAGHAVGEHRGAADAVGVDDGDVGPELGRHQRCFVPAGTATDHHHTIHATILANLDVRGLCAPSSVVCGRALLRRLRVEHGSPSDG